MVKLKIKQSFEIYRKSFKHEPVISTSFKNMKKISKFSLPFKMLAFFFFFFK